jgi:type IV pilus biogenesis protein CpaD/CtpE
MKIKTLFVAALIALLTGCASLDKAITCSEGNRQALIEQNARMVKTQKELESYKAGAKIPGQDVTLFPSREALLAALIENYNQHYDTLVYHVNDYNNLCVNK